MSTPAHSASHAHSAHHTDHVSPTHQPRTIAPAGALTGAATSAAAGAAHAAAPATTFADLNLNKLLLTALNEEGYTTPTPIQAKAIGPILEGKDLLGSAQTGTGKTAAFALPIIHRLLAQQTDKSRRGHVTPRVLVLSPTRELASQIADSFSTYGRHSGLSLTVVFGGVSQYHQVRALQRGVDILVATPGRLMDLMEQGHINLSTVNTFVLDEADRMLDMGFIQPIRRIASSLPKPRQTLLFSATMPKEIMHLADALLTSPVKIAVAPVSSTAERIDQTLYMVGRRQKMGLLQLIIDEENIDKAVVFTKTKHGADKVARRLNMAGISASAIHGNKAQNQRTRTLEAFRSGRTRILVATDVAARGLDVDNISHVFNFDLPMEPEAYVHRIGRTGRAGAEGIAISFCDGEERGLLRDIERIIARKLPTEPLPANLPEPEPYNPDMDRRDFAPRSFNNNNFGNRGRSRSSHPRFNDRSFQPDSRSDAQIEPKYAENKYGDNRSTENKRFDSKPAPRQAHSDHPRTSDHPRSSAGQHHTAHAPKPYAPKAHAPRPHASKPHQGAHANSAGNTSTHSKPHSKPAHAAHKSAAPGASSHKSTGHKPAGHKPTGHKSAAHKPAGQKAAHHHTHKPKSKHS